MGRPIRITSEIRHHIRSSAHCGEDCDHAHGGDPCTLLRAYRKEEACRKGLIFPEHDWREFDYEMEAYKRTKFCLEHRIYYERR